MVSRPARIVPSPASRCPAQPDLFFLASLGRGVPLAIQGRVLESQNCVLVSRLPGLHTILALQDIASISLRADWKLDLPRSESDSGG